MDNIRINPVQAYTLAKFNTSGYFNSDSGSGGNRGSHSGQSFQEIFEQQLEKLSPKSQKPQILKPYQHLMHL